MSLQNATLVPFSDRDTLSDNLADGHDGVHSGSGVDETSQSLALSKPKPSLESANNRIDITGNNNRPFHHMNRREKLPSRATRREYWLATMY